MAKEELDVSKMKWQISGGIEENPTSGKRDLRRHNLKRTSVGSSETVFDVFFAPNVDGAAYNSRRFGDWELADFLEFLRLREEVVAQTLEELARDSRLRRP